MATYTTLIQTNVETFKFQLHKAKIDRVFAEAGPFIIAAANENYVQFSMNFQLSRVAANHAGAAIPERGTAQFIAVGFAEWVFRER